MIISFYDYEIDGSGSHNDEELVKKMVDDERDEKDEKVDGETDHQPSSSSINEEEREKAITSLTTSLSTHHHLLSQRYTSHSHSLLYGKMVDCEMR